MKGGSSMSVQKILLLVGLIVAGAYIYKRF